MEISTLDAGPRVVGRGERALEQGKVGQVWRVVSGVFALERTSASGAQLVHLAWPGDLIGLETLWILRYELSATALINGLLTVHPIESHAAIQLSTAEGFLQQRHSVTDMVQLRTGPVRVRLACFLQLLENKGRLAHLESDRTGLPALRDIAQVIDSTTESVCRELKVLLPRPGRSTARATPPLGDVLLGRMQPAMA